MAYGRVTIRISEYRRMMTRITKSTWTAAILLGLAPVAHGQTTPTFFNDPTFTTTFPSSSESPMTWMGNLDVFRFISSEKQVELPTLPESPSPAPNEQPSTDRSSAQIGSKSDSATQPGWPSDPPNSNPVATNRRFVGAVNESAKVGDALHPNAAHRTAGTTSPSGTTGPSHPVSVHGVAGHGSPEHGSEMLSETVYAAENNRMFVQLDLLTWAVSAPDVSAIGDRASEGIVNVGGSSYFRANSLDTGFITSDWSLGGRVDFGRIEDQRGWMGSVLFFRHQDEINASGVWFVPSDPDGLMAGYQDSNNDGIDDDINVNRIHGRFGEDLGTPDTANPGTFIPPFDGTPDQAAAIDVGDLVNWLITFSTLTANNSVELTGFELVDVYRPSLSARSLDLSWGVRYLEFREKFDVVASGGTLDTSAWNVDSDNDIIGPQVGIRWAANREWFRFTAEGRFLAGLNFQNDRLNGGIAMNATPGGFNEPVALEASSFNSLQTNTEFSPVGEWRVEASYYASSWLAFRIGYTGMAIGGVSRASPKIAYALPSFDLTDVGSNETVLINGLNVGLEINR